MKNLRMFCEELRIYPLPTIEPGKDLPAQPVWRTEVVYTSNSMSNFISSDEAIEFVDYRVLKNEDMTEFREVISRQAITFSENLRNTVNFSPA